MKTKAKVRATAKEMLPNRSLVHTAREVIRAIYHEKRQSILQYVIAHPNCHVNSIYRALGLEQSVTSLFLQELAEVNIAILQDNGRFVEVSINQERLANVYRWIAELYAIMLQYVEDPKITITKKVSGERLMAKQVSVDEKAVRSVTHVLRAFDNMHKRKLLKHLLASDQEISVTDLYIMVRGDQAPTSNYLSRLKSLELVSARREGKFMRYKAYRKYIVALQSYIEKSPL